jgi:hypothetical protein
VCVYIYIYLFIYLFELYMYIRIAWSHNARVDLTEAPYFLECPHILGLHPMHKTLTKFGRGLLKRSLQLAWKFYKVKRFKYKEQIRSCYRYHGGPYLVPGCCR